MKKRDYIIGIDPDIKKSGMCRLVTNIKTVELATMSFPDLIEYLLFCQRMADTAGKTLIVVVEAGWLNEKSCFHVAQGRGVEKIAKDVGANHQVGRLIIEMCRHNKIEVIEQRPLLKCWKGKDGKITHEELAEFICGLPGRTNQESRDATLLAWNYSGFPMRIKPQKVSNKQKTLK